MSRVNVPYFMMASSEMFCNTGVVPRQEGLFAEQRGIAETFGEATTTVHKTQ